jgi:hypothetical protein
MGAKINMEGWIMSEHGVPDSRVTVLYDTGERTNKGEIYWLCKCSCGKEFKAKGGYLRQKKNGIKSCGCLRKERFAKTMKEFFLESEEDLTGKDFGYWHVDSRSESRANGRVMWNCTCIKCGTKKEVIGSSLKNGSSQSCGCTRISHGEQKIKELLEENNIPFEKEKIFEDCKNKKTLPFDFYVNDNYIIEFDGIQHFKATRGWNNEEKFATTKEHDRIKNEYCFNNNIPIIRIPYTHLDNICLDDLLLETSKYILKAESE